MFFRSSPAVLSVALNRDLGFTGEQLADLSAVFFYSFAASQLPVGAALDRLGARRTMTVLAVAGLIGALLFTYGTTPDHLIAARVFLGIGMSGNLMVVLALLAAWFPVDRFAFLSGVVVAVGVAGSLLAATPLAALSAWLGWRETFLVFTVIDFVAVTTFILVTKDRPTPARGVHARPEPVFRGLWRLCRMYSYWAISLSSFVRYGYFAALQSLWAAPFLVYGFGYGEIAASTVILCMGLGYMVGLPLSGFISDGVVRSRKKVVLTSLLSYGLCALLMVFVPASAPLWLVCGAFFVLGSTAAPGQILYAHMKELIPPAMLAQAITAVNLFTVLGGGLMTHLVALVVGNEPSVLTSPAGFDGMWYLGFLCLAAVSVLYSLVPDTKAATR
jgi:MFS family permease